MTGQRNQICRIVNRMATLINCMSLLVFIALLRLAYGRLNKLSNHFDAPHYILVKNKHSRLIHRLMKRSTHGDPAEMSLSFRAFGRKFKLYLKRDTSEIFPPHAKILKNHGNPTTFDADFLVAGWMSDEESSVVKGLLTKDGLFFGTIESRSGTYFIEPADKYFRNSAFYSVIHRKQDGKERLRFDFNFTSAERRRRGDRLRGFKIQDKHQEKRRALSSRSVSEGKKICSLSLEADYSFLKMAGSRRYAIHMIINHIQSLNDIFHNSFVNNFNRTRPRIIHFKENSLQFEIASNKIYNESQTEQVLGQVGLDAATFLRRLQERKEYSPFCLALFFTARSFTDGVLGVVNPGGACTIFNPGILSFTREGTVLPVKITEVSLAHVVGLAFGAKHDEDTRDCKHDGMESQFVMTKYGVDGNHPHNNLFSPCSVKLMTKFIRDLKSKTCLVQSLSGTHALCGNGVVDDDEECDCGNENTCQDIEPGRCCDFKTCKLSNHAWCSVSDGLCCDGRTCNYKNRGEICATDTECSDHSLCVGNSSVCPEAHQKQNFSECNMNSTVCMNGVCSGLSVCKKFNLDPCFCEKRMDECKICCIYEGKCFAADNIAKIKSKLKSIFLSPGSLCGGRKGYCDVFHECHPINLNAPFQSHRYHLYFRRKGVKEITHRFWWAIFLGSVALVACVVIFIQHAVLYTKSSSPDLNEREPAKKLPVLKLSRLKEEERGIIDTDNI